MSNFGMLDLLLRIDLFIEELYNTEWLITQSVITAMLLLAHRWLLHTPATKKTSWHCCWLITRREWPFWSWTCVWLELESRNPWNPLFFQIWSTRCLDLWVFYHLYGSNIRLNQLILVDQGFVVKRKKSWTNRKKGKIEKSRSIREREKSTRPG